MTSFVIDKNGGSFKLNDAAAKCIYQCLNEEEQKEVDSWLNKNNNMDLSKVISILYGSVSQRRRMNERLVEGVKKYLTKNKNFHLKVVEIPEVVKYIKLDIVSNKNKLRENLLYSSAQEPEYEDIDLWLKQIDMKTESEINIHAIPEKVAICVESTLNNSLWVKIKRFFKKLKRNLFYRKKNNRFREKKKAISAVNQYKGRKYGTR